jgi:hypothetical protein
MTKVGVFVVIGRDMRASLENGSRVKKVVAIPLEANDSDLRILRDIVSVLHFDQDCITIQNNHIRRCTRDWKS